MFLWAKRIHHLGEIYGKKVHIVRVYGVHKRRGLQLQYRRTYDDDEAEKESQTLANTLIKDPLQ